MESTGRTSSGGAGATPFRSALRSAGWGGAPSKAEDGGPAAASGYYLFGVVRARNWRSLAGRGEADALLRVRYRDLEALARLAPYRLPQMDREHLVAHQRAVEGIMRRANILPLPPGVVFRGRRSLIRFLEDQYVALDEGLAFLEGHWELRLHIAPAAAADADPELHRLAAHLYAELRRFARAAVPFPHPEQALLSAAFLVGRDGWIDFVERAEDLGGAHPELVVDVTGPWPPYDFVRATP